MSIFRRKTIFHVEDALPDPEELKLRFRRRVLLLTFVGFLAVLSIPVARDLQPDLAARSQTRRFADRILEARTLASVGRAPVSLELDGDSRTWKRVFHARDADCASPASAPEESWNSEVSWKLQVQKSTGETFSGRSLCLHPSQGLLLDAVPVADGKLLITTLNETQNGPAKESAYLILSEFGADLQMLSRSR